MYLCQSARGAVSYGLPFRCQPCTDDAHNRAKAELSYETAIWEAEEMADEPFHACRYAGACQQLHVGIR